MTSALAVLAVATAGGCSHSAPAISPVSDGGDAGLAADAGNEGVACCASWGAPRPVGPLGDPALTELSGLVASRSRPGVLYAHNDSGDTARFFAMSTTGVALGRFTLDGATARDWEDIALGPCDAGTCLWLGDIGDNGFKRTDYAVYRVPEPDLPADGGTVSVPWTRYAYEFPGGEKHNAEALFAHPATGRLYLVTKENSGPSLVFRFPESLDASASNTLDYVTTLTVPAASDGRLTAADVSPCGRAVLLRLYNRLVELRLPDGEHDFERIFAATPVEVPAANDPQGESVAYSADGRAFYTSSEKLVEPCPLHEYRCR